MRDVTQPTLENLAYILRNKKRWPKGYVFSYEDADTCAMGLAHRMWGEKSDRRGSKTSGMSRLFLISQHEADNLFIFGGLTPAAIARSITAFVKRKELENVRE